MFNSMFCSCLLSLPNIPSHFMSKIPQKPLIHKSSFSHIYIPLYMLTMHTKYFMNMLIFGHSQFQAQIYFLLQT